MNVEGCERGQARKASGPPALTGWCPATDLPMLNSNEVRVWLVNLDDGLSPDDAEVAEPGPELDVLDEIEKARAARFVRACHRRRFARCRSALRQILGGLLQESPRSLLFRAVAQGKPELDFAAMGWEENDARVDFRFNVSHSSELALIAVCRGRAIGVDIERIKHVSEADRIVASFFTAAEQAEFAAVPERVKALAFFRGWTRKEAVLKGLGIGLAGLSAHYETGFGTKELPPRFVPALPAPGIKGWELWEAAPRGGFVATVAVHIPGED